MTGRLLCFALLLATTTSGAVSEPIADFLEEYCTSCHGPAIQSGGMRVDELGSNLAEEATRSSWDLVARHVSTGFMPLERAPKQPSDDERRAFLDILKAEMAQAARTATPGGTLVRRLNRVEYLNTLRALFDIRGLKLVNTFPEDAPELEFDTMPEGLYLSPAHLDGYFDMATEVANRLVQLPSMPHRRFEADAAIMGADPTRKWTREEDPAGIYFSGVNSSAWAAGGFWIPGFTAHRAGVYRVSARANAEAAAGADGKPLRLVFYASDPTLYEIPRRALTVDLPKVCSVDVTSLEPDVVRCDVPLEQGEMFFVFCENRFKQGKFPSRSLKQEVNKLAADAKTDSSPTIRLEHLDVKGPVRPLARQFAFLGGQEPVAEEAYFRRVLLPLAEEAWRRPLSQSDEESLIADVMRHVSTGRSAVYGIHYGVRRILTSSRFLYRETRDGVLDDFALAGRVSYFLWSSPPDQRLLGLARTKTLSRPALLGGEALRMIGDPRAQEFVKHFTGQWLGNRNISTVMICDNKYDWDELARQGFIRSTEMFFEAILEDNLSIRNFIDSDFTYANEPMKSLWGLPTRESLARWGQKFRHYQGLSEPTRINLAELEASGRVGERGGLLGLPSVLMATGDGVESSPILRGVWVLENLFGTPLPPPPASIPAIDITTTNAKTIRETLGAHTKSETCASCHREIDPLGLALENYDAIGGWRNHYASRYSAAPQPSDKILDKDPVETQATLPDGTVLTGPKDIKEYLLARPQLFTRSLTTKLLEYGTGRKPSVGDRRVIDEIVAEEPDGGFGFQDLLVRVIQSEAFTTK